MTLPEPVAAYFEADRAGDAARLLAAFDADAVVRDEGRTHAGHAAIRAWWLDAKARYAHVAVPVAASAADGTLAVRAEVSGNFAGSPAMLNFVFDLEGGRIAGLSIG